VTDAAAILHAEFAGQACRWSWAAAATLLVLAGCGESSPAPEPAPGDAGIRIVNPARQPAGGSLEPPPVNPQPDPVVDTPADGGPRVVGNPADPAEVLKSAASLGVRVVNLASASGDPPRTAVYLDARHVTDEGMIRSDVLIGISRIPDMVLVLDRTPFSARGFDGLKQPRFLTGLSLRHTSIDDVGLRGLADLEMLKWVDLRDTRVTLGAALTVFQRTGVPTRISANCPSYRPTASSPWIWPTRGSPTPASPTSPRSPNSNPSTSAAPPSATAAWPA